MGNVLIRPEDFVNAALGRIGSKIRLGSLYDGTQEANLALDIYGQTRDYILRIKDYDFAQNISQAVLAPGTPDPPWQFQYLYPDDAIRIRDMYGAAYLNDTNDPLPNLYTRDTAIIDGVETDIVFCNVANATFIYTQQVINPALWDEGFGESVITAIAARLAPALATLEAAKMLGEAGIATVGMTGDIVG